MRWTIAAALAVVVLAACGRGGSSTPLASRSASEIVAAAGNALKNAKSLHMYGTIAESEGEIGVDLHIRHGRGAVGSVSINGASAKLIAIGSTTYMYLSAALAKEVGGPAGARAADRWVLVNDTTNAKLASLAGIATVNTLLAKGFAAAKPSGLNKGTTATIDGKPVIAVSGPAVGGTLYVRTSGTAYPVKLQGPGAKAGAIRFDSWNAPVILTAPTHALTITLIPGD